MTAVFMNPNQRSRSAQGNVRKHKNQEVPPQVGLPLWSAVGLARGYLCGEGDQLQGSALGTGLDYSLPLSMVFVLCIIYCHEVSKQISHQIAGHRDP